MVKFILIEVIPNPSKLDYRFLENPQRKCVIIYLEETYCKTIVVNVQIYVVIKRDIVSLDEIISESFSNKKKKRIISERDRIDLDLNF